VQGLLEVVDLVAADLEAAVLEAAVLEAAVLEAELPIHWQKQLMKRELRPTQVEPALTKSRLMPSQVVLETDLVLPIPMVQRRVRQLDLEPRPADSA
jgi:hypothetical protein